MKIKSIKYNHHHYGRKWEINPIELGEINLIVGKNATGKSSTIKIIRQLADLICGDSSVDRLIYGSAEYEVVFENGNDNYLYNLKYYKGKVKYESLKKNDDILITRNDNAGTIYYEKLGQMLDFETGDGDLAITRKDLLQHPYLKEVQNFGKNLNHYAFATTMGQNEPLSDNETTKPHISLKTSKQVADIFYMGNENENYINNILTDFKAIDYNINGIKIDKLHHPTISEKVIAVNEDSLAGYTDQTEMSSGMFRALSLIIQLEYSIANNLSSCILIDDIGEGLDFNRSSKLIKLLIEKAKQNNIQLIMTTNDRFVMNAVDLDYWQIIAREDAKTVFYNKNNSKEAFEDFEFAGLNNSEFFFSEYYKGFK